MRRSLVVAMMLFAACAHHKKATTAKAEPAQAPAKAEAPAATGGVSVEFASSAATKAGAALEDTNYSEQPGDASITRKEFADGVVTYSGQVGLGKGSGWAGIGFWVPVADGKTIDGTKFKTVTLKLASTAPALRLRLAGGDEAARKGGCYPVFMQNVTDKLTEYTIPLDQFQAEGWCGPKAITVGNTMPTFYGFEIADIAVQKKPVTLSVGTITLK